MRAGTFGQHLGLSAQASPRPHDASSLHTAGHHRFFEQLAQEIALTKNPAVAVLGKRRMIRDVAVEPQAAPEME